MAVRPELSGEPGRFALRCVAINGRYEGGDPVVRGVAVDETAKHGRIHDRTFRVCQPGCIPHTVAICARLTCQQGHACRRKRQSQIGHVKLRALDHPGEDYCSFAGDVGLIDMRVGSIADKAISRVCHPV